MLVRTHMEELRENTNDYLYEIYRSEKLRAMGVAQDESVFKETNPALKQAEERAMHEAKLAKMEAEMKMVFQQKVQEKEQKLKQSEEELYARHREMKDALEKQRLELDDKKRRIESGRPLTPEKGSVSLCRYVASTLLILSRKSGSVLASRRDRALRVRSSQASVVPSVSPPLSLPLVLLALFTLPFCTIPWAFLRPPTRA